MLLVFVARQEHHSEIPWYRGIASFWAGAGRRKHGHEESRDGRTCCNTKYGCESFGAPTKHNYVELQTCLDLESVKEGYGRPMQLYYSNLASVKEGYGQPLQLYYFKINWYRGVCRPLFFRSFNSSFFSSHFLRCCVSFVSSSSHEHNIGATEGRIVNNQL